MRMLRVWAVDLGCCGSVNTGPLTLPILLALGIGPARQPHDCLCVYINAAVAWVHAWSCVPWTRTWPNDTIALIFGLFFGFPFSGGSGAPAVSSAFGIVTLASLLPVLSVQVPHTRTHTHLAPMINVCGYPLLTLHLLLHAGIACLLRAFHASNRLYAHKTWSCFFHHLLIHLFRSQLLALALWVIIDPKSVQEHTAAASHWWQQSPAKEIVLSVRAVVPLGAALLVIAHFMLHNTG